MLHSFLCTEYRVNLDFFPASNHFQVKMSHRIQYQRSDFWTDFGQHETF